MYTRQCKVTNKDGSQHYALAQPGHKFCSEHGGIPTMVAPDLDALESLHHMWQWGIQTAVGATYDGQTYDNSSEPWTEAEARQAAKDHGRGAVVMRRRVFDWEYADGE